jgi:hypothetical protein
LRPPVDAIIPISEETAPGMTTRERVAMQTRGAMCQSCHRVINPLGFALENYDALGRYRTEELQQAVDASGQYITAGGERIEFRGARDLADFLVQSEEVRESIARQMFQYMIKQPIAAYGVEQAHSVQEGWVEEGHSLETLARNLVLLALKNSENPGKAGADQISLN